MAKKKKRKEDKKSGNGYNIELTGLLLILIAIIGFGQFGIVGDYYPLHFFSRYIIILLLLFLLWIIYDDKKGKPDFYF